MDDRCGNRSKKRKMVKIACRGCGKILYEPALKRRKISKEEVIVDNADDGYCNSVFTMGDGDVGQLGLGQDELEVAMPTIVSNLPNDIIQVAGGGLHSVCLTEDGQVYSFGLNDEGTLGRKTEEEEDCFPPLPVEICAHIVQVSAGDNHTAALTDDGRVFIWGTFRNAEGNKFLIHNGPNLSVDPIEVINHVFVVKVSSGMNHVVCLTLEGEIYTFGSNYQGQLGRGVQPVVQEEDVMMSSSETTMLLEPDRVCFPEELLPFQNIWTGPAATYAKSATGDIYAWGVNGCYQLGFGDKICRSLPEKWPEMSEDIEWMAIAAGEFHTLALDSRGRVYSVGTGVYGQLGIGRLANDAGKLSETLGLVPKLQNKQCVSIACGVSVSFAVTKDGTVYGWGAASGLLGLGDLNGCDVYVPTPIGGELRTRKVLNVSPGGQHTMILADEPMSKLKCDVDGHISRI